MIVVSEILGTDSFSGSRLTINANFQSLKGEVELLETNLGISTASGNIDVSAATGGQIKGKVGAFNTLTLPIAGSPTISLTGTTGAIVGTSLSVSTVSAATVAISNSLTVTNSSTFNGGVVFNDVVQLQDGWARRPGNVGAPALNLITVALTDNVILFDGSSLSLTLAAGSMSTIEGHTITLVKYGAGVTVLNNALIAGTPTVSFHTGAYKSSITLMWSLSGATANKWIITGSSNMTIS